MTKDLFEIINSFEYFSQKLSDHPALKDEFDLAFQDLLDYKNDLCLKTPIYDKKQLERIIKHETEDFFDKKCPYCGKENFDLEPTDRRKKPGEYDHFIPYSKGGGDFIWNMIYVCYQCNRDKKDTMPEVFLKDKPKVYQGCIEYTNKIREKYYNLIQAKIEGYNAIKNYFQKYLGVLKGKNVYEIVDFLVEIAKLFECSDDEIDKIQKDRFPKDDDLDETFRLEILEKTKKLYTEKKEFYTPRIMTQKHGSKKYRNKKINAKVAREILEALEKDGHGRCEQVRTSIRFIPFMSEESKEINFNE